MGVDKTLSATGVDIPPTQKQRPSERLDSLSTEKMEALAEKLAVLETVLDNAAQRGSLGFISSPSPVPVAAQPPPCVLPTAKTIPPLAAMVPTIEAWVSRSQSPGLGTPRSQQLTPRIGLQLQPSQRRSIRTVAEPRAMVGHIARAASARSSSRSCSPHPPLPPPIGMHFSPSAPNTMILPLVAIGTPPVSGAPGLPASPMTPLSVVGKIRNWLSTIPIGNGADRGWDDKQVESIAAFASEKSLGHLPAEDIYRQYVEHHLEKANES